MEWGSSGTNNSNQTSTTQNNAISEASSEGKKLRAKRENLESSKKSPQKVLIFQVCSECPYNRIHAKKSTKIRKDIKKP